MKSSHWFPFPVLALAPGAAAEAAGMPTNSLREQFDAIAAKPSCTRLFAIASRCAAHSRSAVSYPGFATLPE